MDVLKSYSNIWGGTVDSKKFHEHEISKIAAVFRNVKHQNKIYTLEYNYYLALLQYEHLLLLKAFLNSLYCSSVFF